MTLPGGTALLVPLDLDGVPAVEVQIGCPVLELDGETWVCYSAITGIEGFAPRYCCGADALQALTLTLALMPVLLENTDEAAEGRLTRFGEGSPWGFPRDLLDLPPSSGLAPAAPPG